MTKGWSHYNHLGQINDILFQFPQSVDSLRTREALIILPILGFIWTPPKNHWFKFLTIPIATVNWDYFTYEKEIQNWAIISVRRKRKFGPKQYTHDTSSKAWKKWSGANLLMWHNSSRFPTKLCHPSQPKKTFHPIRSKCRAWVQPWVQKRGPLQGVIRTSSFLDPGPTRIYRKS